ncbi:MAG: hypothetical protein ABIH72_03915 [archaeon]
MKHKTDKLYGKNEAEEKELARKASTTYEYIGKVLESKGHDVREISQIRIFDGWPSSGFAGPSGHIAVKTDDLHSAVRIRDLEELSSFNLELRGGYENDRGKGEFAKRGMHGFVWGNMDGFMRDYGEKFQYSGEWEEGDAPDYVVLKGKDSVSGGLISISIGEVPDKEKYGSKKVILRNKIK